LNALDEVLSRAEVPAARNLELRKGTQHKALRDFYSPSAPKPKRRAGQAVHTSGAYFFAPNPSALASADNVEDEDAIF
jgi:hypothetical protein